MLDVVRHILFLYKKIHFLSFFIYIATEKKVHKKRGSAPESNDFAMLFQHQAPYTFLIMAGIEKLAIYFKHCKKGHESGFGRYTNWLW